MLHDSGMERVHAREFARALGFEPALTVPAKAAFPQ
jgi:hypothetical protein